jgi:hypothetical protein
VAEGHDLDGDLRQVGDLGQVVQLGAHHLGAALGPPQRGFVDDRPHLGRVRAGQQVLAFHAQGDPGVDLPAGAAWWPSMMTARA